MIDPARYLPEQFSLDLKIDSKSENPFISSWREAILTLKSTLTEEISILRGYRADQIHPILDRLSIPRGALSPDKEVKRMNLLGTLYSKRNTLEAVEELATLYFGSVEISRRWPGRASDPDSLVVDDPEAQTTLLLIRSKVAPTEILFKEFHATLKNFLDQPLQVMVHPFPQVKATEKSIPYANGIKL